MIDCAGKVLESCAPDGACADGACIADPCAAALAAKSHLGCEFRPLNLEPYGLRYAQCYAAFVANTWSRSVKLSIERAGESFDPEVVARLPKGWGQTLTYAPYDAKTGLPPGEVAIVFLADGPDPILPPNGEPSPCPSGVTPALNFDSSVHGTGYGDSFRIVTDAPVVASQIYPYGGGVSAVASATLLLPTSSWDTSYVVATPDPGIGFAVMAVVAGESGATVNLKPSIELTPASGVPGAAAGELRSYSLAPGEYLQFRETADLTGTLVAADAPVAVYAGVTELELPLGRGAIDSAHQQLPPVRALGHEYVAVPHPPRIDDANGAPALDPAVFRITAAVGGTLLEYEPLRPDGAPETLEAGAHAEFSSSDAFVVRAQDAEHPIHLAAAMTGSGGLYADPDDKVTFFGQGDPEWVNVTPAAQYLSSYVFFADPTYPETHLVVVRSRSNAASVELDCAGPIEPWLPVGAYEYAYVALSTGDFESVGLCAPGRHEMTSDQPFGVTVWGWGSPGTTPYSAFTSYAYPAGQSTRSINPVSVLEPPH